MPKSRFQAGDNQKNRVLGVQGRHLVSDHLHLHYVLARTNDSQITDVLFRDGETGFRTWVDQDLDAATTSLRGWIEYTWGRNLFELGAEAARSDNRVTFRIDTEDPRFVIPDTLKRFNEDQDYSRSGAFVQNTFSLARGLDLKAGVRWDRSGLSGMSATSPRASLVWRPRAAWELRAAWGHYCQFPSFETLQSDGFFLDLRGIKEARLRPEHAQHVLTGFAFTSSRAGWKFAVDVYEKPLRDILTSGREEETILVLGDNDQAQPYTRRIWNFFPENSQRGYARGAQAVFTLQEGPSRPYHAMVAYTFGRVRTRDDALWRWEDHDQRHSSPHGRLSAERALHALGPLPVRHRFSLHPAAKRHSGGG